jgi:hypothetical protein
LFLLKPASYLKHRNRGTQESAGVGKPALYRQQHGQSGACDLMLTLGITKHVTPYRLSATSQATDTEED